MSAAVRRARSGELQWARIGGAGAALQARHALAHQRNLLGHPVDAPRLMVDAPAQVERDAQCGADHGDHDASSGDEQRPSLDDNLCRSPRCIDHELTIEHPARAAATVFSGRDVTGAV